MQMLIKHRYSYIDPDIGCRVETQEHMTAEAAAGAGMIDALPIIESREEHFVSDSPTPGRHATSFPMPPRR